MRQRVVADGKALLQALDRLGGGAEAALVLRLSLAGGAVPPEGFEVVPVDSSETRIPITRKRIEDCVGARSGK